MPKISPFENHTNHYEAWFEKNHFAYQSELQAIKLIIPKNKKGLEVGSGSALFCEPLGIKYGIDPSEKMNQIARQKGINVDIGIAENLPYEKDTFDFILMVTSICFVDDIDKTFSEAFRVLKDNGQIILGYVDKDSPIGKEYERNKNTSLFYKEATFFSTKELTEKLSKNQFRRFSYKQTLFKTSSQLTSIDEIKDGYGEGSFIVLKAQKLRK